MTRSSAAPAIVAPAITPGLTDSDPCGGEVGDGIEAVAVGDAGSWEEPKVAPGVGGDDVRGTALGAAVGVYDNLYQSYMLYVSVKCRQKNAVFLSDSVTGVGHVECIVWAMHVSSLVQISSKEDPC